ncbi:MAG: gas vesicle protein GvpN [Nanoarchaeota archaeon]
MKFKHYGHKRTIRGKPVHITQAERERTIVEREKAEESASHYASKDVEAKFLTPKSVNFIETDEIKEYERRIELWMKAGYPVHIIGPTGCGKTALAIRMAEKLGRPSMWINGDEAITTSDLIGGYSRIEMTTVRDKYIHNVYKDRDVIEPQWVSNPLALACQNGYTLIYNEFARTRPEANNVLLSVLEEGVLELPTKFGEERYVKVHPNFNVIMTSNNIEYAGVHKPQDALLDRVVAIHMDYYNKETETEIVQAHSKISKQEAERIVNIVRALRKKLNGPERPGTRPAIMIAQGLMTADGYDEKYFEQVCVDAIANKFESLEDVTKKIAIIREQITRFN